MLLNVLRCTGQLPTPGFPITKNEPAQNDKGVWFEKLWSHSKEQMPVPGSCHRILCPFIREANTCNISFTTVCSIVSLSFELFANKP